MHFKNNMRYTDDIVIFFGIDAPFSNFYLIEFTYSDYYLKNSEQAFMLEKAMMFDKGKIPLILAAKSPTGVKKLGRTIQNFDPEVWDKNRYKIMINVLKAKFANPILKQILIDTEDLELVEGSPYDAIWGVKLDWMSDEILDRNNWRGSNLLGKALMEVREYYLS
jgi:ribA/ribD-fused uncharacterized protein